MIPIVPSDATHIEAATNTPYRLTADRVEFWKGSSFWRPSSLSKEHFLEGVARGDFVIHPRTKTPKGFSPTIFDFYRGDKVRHPNGRQLEVVANHKGLVVCWDPEYHDYEGVPPVDLRTEEEYWKAMADETQRREETEALRRVVEKHHIIGLKTSSAVARELHRAGLRVVEEK